MTAKPSVRKMRPIQNNAVASQDGLCRNCFPCCCPHIRFYGRQHGTIFHDSGRLSVTHVNHAYRLVYPHHRLFLSLGLSLYFHRSRDPRHSHINNPLIAHGSPTLSNCIANMLHFMQLEGNKFPFHIESICLGQYLQVLT